MWKFALTLTLIFSPLIIWGERETISSAESIAILIALSGGSIVVTYAGCGLTFSHRATQSPDTDTCVRVRHHLALENAVCAQPQPGGATKAKVKGAAPVFFLFTHMREPNCSQFLYLRRAPRQSPSYRDTVDS